MTVRTLQWHKFWKQIILFFQFLYATYAIERVHWFWRHAESYTRSENRWHAITLSECIKNKMILRGQRNQRVPSSKNSESFIRAWKNVCLFNRCTSLLMENAIQYVYKYECMLLHLERINWRNMEDRCAHWTAVTMKSKTKKKILAHPPHTGVLCIPAHTGSWRSPTRRDSDLVDHTMDSPCWHSCYRWSGSLESWTVSQLGSPDHTAGWRR